MNTSEFSEEKFNYLVQLIYESSVFIDPIVNDVMDRPYFEDDYKNDHPVYASDLAGRILYLQEQLVTENPWRDPGTDPPPYDKEVLAKYSQFDEPFYRLVARTGDDRLGGADWWMGNESIDEGQPDLWKELD